jgi:hypothetical protein
MSGNWKVKFLDFDWAGVRGKAVYPVPLNRDLQWPVGAAWGKPITRDHDLWQLEMAFSVRV